VPTRNGVEVVDVVEVDDVELVDVVEVDDVEVVDVVDVDVGASVMVVVTDVAVVDVDVVVEAASTTSDPSSGPKTKNPARPAPSRTTIATATPAHTGKGRSGTP
jgi:hypothetical protein